MKARRRINTLDLASSNVGRAALLARPCSWLVSTDHGLLGKDIVGILDFPRAHSMYVTASHIVLSDMMPMRYFTFDLTRYSSHATTTRDRFANSSTTTLVSFLKHITEPILSHILIMTNTSIQHYNSMLTQEH